MQSLLKSHQQQTLVKPWVVWLYVLLVIALAEFAIMGILPWIFPEQDSPIWESIIDALGLPIIVAPVLWWSIVLPLQRTLRLREWFLGRVFSSIEDERRRIAYDIHDGLGQSLTLLISGLRSLPDQCDTTELQRRRQDLQAFAERALSDAKQLALGLRPSLLDDFGLVVALQRLVADTCKHQPIEIKFTTQHLPEERLPDVMETALFRITQEAISNIIKHSEAHSVTISLSCVARDVKLVITDDGHGIDRHKLIARQAQGGHLGLSGMQERAIQLQGSFEIHSSLGQGCQIVVTVPLPGRTP
ncbi:MAG: sensor histidine kinase [Planctomycetota bacterium]